MEQQDYINRDENGKKYCGTHVIIDIRHPQAGTLDDVDFMENVFREAVKVGGANLLHIALHKFEPTGVTGVAILSESHISVHTWPDQGFAAFDIFMCGESDPVAAAEYIKSVYQPLDSDIQVFKRGMSVLNRE